VAIFLPVARYFIRLSYKGTAYQGWQVQPHTTATVQHFLNEKLSMLLREPIGCTGCGRTDTGVHAREFFAHFDFGGVIPENAERFVYHLNSVLPKDIAVQQLYKMHDTAHARFDATFRSYEYHLVRRKDAFNDHMAWENRDVLNADVMNEAAAIILQYEDFGAFCKAGSDVKTTLCRVTKASWFDAGDYLVFEITANRFLRNMVRAIVGTLVDAGRGKIKPEDMHRIIQSGDRSEAGQSVPAHGLYLTKVEYPLDYKL
jgi:tRNA pseudouridine38-40 synthase